MFKRMFLIMIAVLAISVLFYGCTTTQATTGLSIAASLKRLDTQTPLVKNTLVNEVRPLMVGEDQAKLDKLLLDAELLAAQVRMMTASSETADLVMLGVQARPMVAVGRDLVSQADLIISPVITQLSLAKQIELRSYRADLTRLGKLIDIIDDAIDASPEALNWTQVLSDVATITSAIAPVAL
ncbi:MAG: hypothetical protein KZQ93_15860 [Candidatus Thiodiazotropha sp. (ex Monitilora ramsayi)]|nr:hypothetical protein [Candidatus Thiodiazotropha sp. (ex Monitilora ramsayi)]